MTRIVITGHASLDHVALLDGVPAPGRTTTILARPEGAWPRLGGGPAYVAAALVAGGEKDVFPVSWVGDDEDGREYRRQLLAAGIPDAGLAAMAGARTPAAILAYVPAGGCICLYDPGMAQDIALTPPQRSLVGEADIACLTIGPPSITEEVMDLVAPSAVLVWIVKHDPRSLPRKLAARIAGRADFILYSESEAGLVRAAIEEGDKREDQTLIVTRGGKGATLIRGSISETVPAEPLAVNDPTGAGDSFAGGVVAAIARGETDSAALIRSGHMAAAAMLRRRPANETESA